MFQLVIMDKIKFLKRHLIFFFSCFGNNDNNLNVIRPQLWLYSHSLLFCSRRVFWSRIKNSSADCTQHTARSEHYVVHTFIDDDHDHDGLLHLLSCTILSCFVYRLGAQFRVVLVWHEIYWNKRNKVLCYNPAIKVTPYKNISIIKLNNKTFKDWAKRNVYIVFLLEQQID